MSNSTNAVDAAADLIRERIRELDAERGQLEKALSSLTGVGTGSTAGRRGGAKRSKTTTRGRSTGLPKISQRRRKGGTRAEQAVKLIGNNPGIAAGEIAKQLNLKPNYMYRVLSDLQAAGHVVKKGRAYSLPDTQPAEETAS